MKTITHRSNVILAVGLAALIIPATTFMSPVCAAESTLTPEQAAAKMEAARMEVAVTRSNIVQTLEQLDLVRRSADPRAQFEKFTEQLARMEERAKFTRERAQAMGAKVDAYFADWEAQVAAIQDPERRKQVEASYARRKKAYNRITEFMQKAGKDFAPLLSSLKEIQILLEGNPDSQKVAAAKELFSRANWRCVDVQKSLMEVEREFEILAADFAGKGGMATPAGKP
jgi:hypothetical protein